MKEDESFSKMLEQGREGEKFIASMLELNDWKILPSYEYTGKRGDKAPKLQGKYGKNIVPDLLVFRKQKQMWVEVKTKKSFDYSRGYKINTHGIERRCYDDYLKVEKETGIDVWLVVCEIETSDVLVAKLSSLTPFDCLCKSCKNKNYFNCKMSRGGMIFFDRKEFSIWKDLKGKSISFSYKNIP